MVARRCKSLVALVAAVAMIAVFAGTASAGRRSVAAAGAATCDSPGVTDSTIKIGVLGELSGAQAATFADLIKGLKARLAKLQDDGGLPGGRNIEFVVADDGADDTQNLTAAKRLVEEENVFMVFEITSHSRGSASYLHQKGIPVVGWAIDPVWGTYDNFFGYRNSFSKNPESHTTVAPTLLKKLGAKRIAVLGFDNSASQSSVKNAVASIKQFGLKVAYQAIVPAGSTEFTAIAQKMKEKKADGIYTAMDFLQNAPMMQAVIDAGIRDQFKAFVFPFGYDPRIPAAFPSLEGGVVGTDFKPYELNLPGHQAFFKYYAQVNGADAVASQISMVAWLSAEAMIKGFEVAGDCPTQAGYIKKLRKVKGFDADGLIQPVDFKTAFGKPILCLYYVQLQAAKWVPLFNGQPLCGKELK